MKAFLEVAMALLNLLPAITQAVTAVEAAIPGSGKGAEKLALVKATLTAAQSVVQTATPIVQTLWPAIEQVVGAVVSTFNRTGTFKPSDKTP